MKEKISIIIPTRNSGKTIDRCLQSIYKQSYKNIEIIIVDQESEDSTIMIAEKYGCIIKSIPQSTVYSPPTKSRNVGARLSTGSILFHLDSDMELSDGLIDEIMNVFENNPEIGALIVHEIDLTNNFWGTCKSLERRTYWGNTTIESARVIKKDLFDRIGGYDEDINTGEDFDIQDRLSHYANISFCRNVVYHNLKNFSLRESILKKYNYGQSAEMYFSKKSKNPFSLLWEEMKCFVSNYKLLLKSPLISLGMILLKIVEIFSGLCGLLKNKFGNATKKKSYRTFFRKILIFILNVKNFYMIIFDKMGCWDYVYYEFYNGCSFKCRCKSTDIHELVVIMSGFEYPSEYIQLSDGDVLFDLGANIGSFCVFSKFCNPYISFRGYAFEPVDENYELLLLNTQKNKIDNFLFYKMAISDCNEKVMINTKGKKDAFYVDKSGGDELVESRQLSFFCNENGIDKIHLLKMDVEGSEYAILEKDFDFIINHIERIIMEYHEISTLHNSKFIYLKLEKFFDIKELYREKGYGVLYLQRKGFIHE